MIYCKDERTTDEVEGPDAMVRSTGGSTSAGAHVGVYVLPVARFNATSQTQPKVFIIAQVNTFMPANNQSIFANFVHMPTFAHFCCIHQMS